MGQCVDVSPTSQVESPVLGLVSVSRQDPREGTTRGELVRGDLPVAVDLPSRASAPECKASAEKKRASRGVRQEKGNFIRGKREGDWPLIRTLSDEVFLIPCQCKIL